MNSHELFQIKMAWLVAEEAGDTQAKLTLLHNYPDLQDALIDFVAAYHATSPAGSEPAILPITQRAMQHALEHIFKLQVPTLSAHTLRELRTGRGLTLMATARSLNLGVDVWKKFEDGLIELQSLGERQLSRLATFFQITSEQFGNLLNQSQPTIGMNRRQTAEAARHEQQGSSRQSFSEALAKSTMSSKEKQIWLEQ